MSARDQLERDLQTSGERVCRQLGFQTYRLSQPRASKQTPGLADTFVCGLGVTAWIEWKRPGERQTEAQLGFELDVTMNNGRYVVIHSLEELTAWVQGLR